MTLLDFIKRVEGDDSRPLGNGLFGSTWDPYGKTWNLGPGITKGITKTTVMTKQQIDAAVEAELSSTVAGVDRLIKVPLGNNRRVALYSFAYNVGLGAFEKSSVLTYVNAGKLDQVPARLSLYTYAGGVKVSGLVNRRNQEITLWNTADDQPQPQTATVSQPAKEIKTMANTPAPVTTAPTTTNIFQSLLDTAKTDILAVYTKITGIVTGLATGGASMLLTSLIPGNTLALVIGIVGGAAGLLTAVVHLYTLFTGLSANNNATIVLAEHFLNTVQQDLGAPVTVWDNDPATANPTTPAAA